MLSRDAELFFRRLMSVVDDFGRYDARTSVLRPACFPVQVDSVTEAEISRWLVECRKAGLIGLYTVGGKPYLELFRLHKNVKSRRNKHSKWPNSPFPQEHDGICIQMKTDARNCVQLRPYGEVVNGEVVNGEVVHGEVTDADKKREEKENTHTVGSGEPTTRVDRTRLREMFTENYRDNFDLEYKWAASDDVNLDLFAKEIEQMRLDRRMTQRKAEYILIDFLWDDPERPESWDTEAMVRFARQERERVERTKPICATA